MAGYFYGKNTSPIFAGAVPGITSPTRTPAQPGAVGPPDPGGERVSCKGNCIRSYPPGISRRECIAECDAARIPPTGAKGGGGSATVVSGEPYEGCGSGKFYNARSSSDCMAGYVWVAQSDDPNYPGRCECSKWCQDIGYAADCVTKVSGAKGGEFKFPSELQDLYMALVGKGKNLLTDWSWSPEMKDYGAALLGRGREALERKPGFSESFINMATTQGVDTMRRQAAVQKAAELRRLQNEGLLGTGAGKAAISGLDLSTSQNVGGMIRDLFLQNEAKKKQDYTDMTGLAQSIFGQGMEFEKTPEAVNQERTKLANLIFSGGMDFNTAMEAINASRRSEGMQQWLAWLKYISDMMGSYGA